MSGVPRPRSVLGVASVLLLAVVSGCGGDASTSATASVAAIDPSSAPPSPTATERGVRLGISNGVDGDPWSTAMICTVKAQARTSERVDRLVVADRGTDGAGQAADLGNLVAAGVDAIVVHPRDPAALVEVVTDAVARGVVVVAVGRAIPVEGAYAVATDQEARGAAAVTWLAEAVGGKGRILYLRGDPEDPVDQARDAGVRRALEAVPDVEVAAEIATQGDPALAVERLNALIAKKEAMDGLLTTGPDGVLVDALKTADTDLLPIAGGDGGAFVSQLLTETGLIGAAITDPPAVGGAAVDLALRVLAGEIPAEPVVRIPPEVWANDTDEGRARLSEANDPDIELGWPLSLTLPGRTTYEVADAIACLGPGA